MMLDKKFIMLFALTVIMVFVVFIDQTKAGIIEKGLVSYYSFNNIKGDVVKDDWGGNDGTIIGPKVAAGKYGDALSFDGQDDYVNCGNDDSLNITKAISIEAWVYMKSPGTYPAIVTKSGTNWGYIFQFLTTTAKINFAQFITVCSITYGVSPRLLYGVKKSYNNTKERRNPCLLSHIFMNFSTNRNAKNTYINYDGKIDPLSALVVTAIALETGVYIIAVLD